MKWPALLVVCVPVLLVSVGASVPPQAQPGQQAPPEKKSVPSVAGKWIVTLEMSMGTATPALDLKQDGTKITGTYTGR